MTWTFEEVASEPVWPINTWTVSFVRCQSEDRAELRNSHTDKVKPCVDTTGGHITLPMTSLYLLYTFAPNGRLYFSLLVLWPLPHRPNGSKQFYGCPLGNHSVNGGLCFMLLAFTIAEAHRWDSEAREGRGSAVRNSENEHWDRCNEVQRRGLF